MSKRRWTKNEVIEAIEAFRGTHGRLPCVKELDIDPMLPSHTVVTRWAGMPYSELLQKRYQTTIEECRKMRTIDSFKKVYNEIRPCCYQDYMDRKPADAPVAKTIIRIVQGRSWNDLIHSLQLESYAPSRRELIVVHSEPVRKWLEQKERNRQRALEMDAKFIREGRNYEYLKHVTVPKEMLE